MERYVLNAKQQGTSVISPTATACFHGVEVP